jgi:hypothetical protein
MAKIYEEIIVIKLSTLIKDGAKDPQLATAELLEALSGVADELVGSGIVVEVEKA